MKKLSDKYNELIGIKYTSRGNKRHDIRASIIALEGGPIEINELTGKRITLWRTEYRQGAYTDRFGIEHDTWVVIDEVVVTIVETKDAPEAWGEGIIKNGEQRAVDGGGYEYFRFGNGLWSGGWEDAEECTARRKLNIYPNGRKAEKGS